MPQNPTNHTRCFQPKCPSPSLLCVSEVRFMSACYKNYTSQWRAITDKNMDKFVSTLRREIDRLPSLPNYKDLQSALNRAKTNSLGRIKPKTNVNRESPELERLKCLLGESLLTLQKCPSSENILKTKTLDYEVREARAKQESKEMTAFLDQLENLHQISKMRLFYKKVKGKTKNKQNPTYVIHDPKTPLKNPTFSTNKMEFLNFWKEYYENIFKTTDLPDYQPPSNASPISSFDKPLTIVEVQSAINSVSSHKRHKAPGFDEITNEDLRFINNINPSIIFIILKNIWETEKCPLEFKRCLIHVIPKPSKAKTRKDHRFQKNYRPIALLSTLRKLYEIILTDRIINNVLLSEHQFGFRQKRSTIDCLFLLRELTLEARYCLPGKRGGRGPQKLYAAFLDFKGAFDNVPRELVWEKLQNRFGICGKLLRNLVELFSDVRGQALLHGSLTPQFNISKGVVQGSVLGPVLFILFIDDLLEELQRSGYGFPFFDNIISVLAYADDLTLLCHNAPGLRKLLLISQAWANRNSMSFGVDKCYVVIFNSLSKQERQIFKLNENYLETRYPPSSDLYLGHTISDNITVTKIFEKTNLPIKLKPHFRSKPYPNYLSLLKSKFRRARAGTLLLNPETQILQPNISIHLFKSITRSTLLYACEATDFDCDQLLSLEKLQSVTLRRILNLDKRCPKALVRLVTGVEPLEARFNLHKLMYFVKLAKSNKSSLLHAVHNRRMTDFGATPLGFHHTIYNLLIKYGLTNLWEMPKDASVLELKSQIKAAIWRYHWEKDLIISKACHTPLSKIFLSNINFKLENVYYKPHELMCSLKTIHLPRSAASRALRFWTTPIRNRTSTCGLTTEDLPRHLFFACSKSAERVRKFKNMNDLGDLFLPGTLNTFLRSLIGDKILLRNFHEMLSDLDFPRF